MNTAKKSPTPKQMAEIRGGIRAALSARGLANVPMREVERALQWPSVVRMLAEDPIYVEDVVEKATRYLRRTLQKQQKEVETYRITLVLERPQRREIDTRHGISYALAISAQKDEEVQKILTQCRQHYWEQDRAPFPWLNAGSASRTDSRQAAERWLGRHEMLYPEVADVQIALSVRSPESAALYKELLGLVSEPYTDDVEDLLARLTASLRKRQAAVRPIAVLGDTYLADVDIHLKGHSLELGITKVYVSERSYLMKLHQATDQLHERLHWPKEDVLRFVMTDEPPSPQKMVLEKKVGRKMPKTLSFDHTALLQLVYMLEKETWPARLRVWDRWLTQEPEEGLSMKFQSSQPHVIASEAQRVKWMTKEYKRALARAESFSPFVQWRE